MKKIELEYVGIDYWSRPVFQTIEKPYRYYGSVEKLFDHLATRETILKQVTEVDLCYFGREFGCEPDGTVHSNITIRR